MIPDFVGTSIMGGIITSLVTLLSILAIIIFAIQRNYQLRKMEHQVKMKALEKGYDIPAIPAKRRPNYPFTWPFVFIGFGLGLLVLYYSGEGDAAALGFGLIIMFIGVGLTVSRFYGVRKDEMERNERDSLRRWQAPVTDKEETPVDKAE